MSSRPRRQVPVYLSVYDLSPNNAYLHSVGLGAYHSGVAVYGKEYTFGGGESSGTGVFSHAPTKADGCVFREQVLLGHVQLSVSEVDAAVAELKPLFRAADYHVLHRNCNCFSDALARRLLGGRGIPGWVNRMAVWGGYCSCCLPAEMQKPAGVPSAAEQVPLVQPRSSFRAFSGQGNALDSSASSSSAAPSSAPARAAASSGETPEERRQRLSDAALARLAKASDASS